MDLAPKVGHFTNTKNRRRDDVKIAFLFEWDNPKNEERLQKLLKHRWDNVEPFMVKMIKEKEVKVETKYWQDINGRYHEVHEYESVEEFAKIWTEEWLKIWGTYVTLMDNYSHKVMWPPT